MERLGGYRCKFFRASLRIPRRRGRRATDVRPRARQGHHRRRGRRGVRVQALRRFIPENSVPVHGIAGCAPCGWARSMIRPSRGASPLFPAGARRVGVFHRKDEKYSAYGLCETCRFLCALLRMPRMHRASGRKPRSESGLRFLLRVQQGCAELPGAVFGAARPAGCFPCTSRRRRLARLVESSRRSRGTHGSAITPAPRGTAVMPVASSLSLLPRALRPDRHDECLLEGVDNRHVSRIDPQRLEERPQDLRHDLDVREVLPLP